MKLTIIIPVFNEEKTINEILNRVVKAKLLSGIKKEVIVIDDGSTDKTLRVLSEFKIINYKIKILRHNKNQGKGAAIRTGLKYATGNYVIIQDADLEYDPKDYLKLLQPILDGKTDVVYGNRFENYPLIIWGKNKTALPIHWISNFVLATITNTIYGSNLRDMETCYKLFTKGVLDSLDLNANGFEFEPEITAKILKKGYKIFDVPISISPRTYKEGKKITWKDGIIAVCTLIKYRFVD